MIKSILKSVCMGVLCVTLLVGIMTIALPSGHANAATSVKLVSAIKNNKQYYITNTYMRKWQNAYSPGKGRIYAKYFEKSHPAGVLLKWKLTGTSGSLVTKSAKVYVSVKKNMKNAKVYSATGGSTTVDNLLAGTKYYWYVTCKYNGKKLKSKVYTFRTRRTIRTMNVDRISNVRDIGGYKAGGGKVRQGMIYRSANLDDISAKGKKTMLNDMKIRTELDLRRVGEDKAGKIKPLGSNANYINISGLGYNMLWDEGYDHNIIAKEIAIFASKKNYPVVFHCEIGRDRTGTLAFLINALLGVSVRDLFRDYETSFFSVAGCYNLTTPKIYYDRFYNLYAKIKQYGTDSSTFAQKTELFLMERGVTKVQIENIRKIMIEK